MDFGLIRFHKYNSSDITLVLKKIMPRHQSKYSPDQLYNRQNPANNDNTLFFFSLNLTSTTVACHRRNECRHLTMIPYATIEEATCSVVICYRDVMKMFILVVGPLQLVSHPSIQVRSLDLCPMNLELLLCNEDASDFYDRWLRFEVGCRYHLVLRL